VTLAVKDFFSCKPLQSVRQHDVIYLKIAHSVNVLDQVAPY